MREHGYLVLSLDTELAWGYYDDDDARERLFSADGSRERRSIERVLALCDDQGIRATWAMVGHLFFSQCEDCAPCPVAAWRDDHRGFREVHVTGQAAQMQPAHPQLAQMQPAHPQLVHPQPAHPQWYAPDVRDLLLAASDRHELAFHGFSHRPFHQMDADAAQSEVQAWLAVAGRFGVKPESIVFPRNRVGHLPLFADAGFRCFRAPDRTPRWHLRRFGSALKSADDLLALSTPRVYRREQLRREQGLIRVPSSAHLFDFPRGLELRLDRVGLQRLRLRGIAKAIDHAARSGGILHLWAHPWELRTPADEDKLEYLLGLAAEQIAAGRLRSITMSELSALASRTERR
ncbi:hypothetical protein CKO42_13260 [Lamprobacter modestohalophilus]|uniref:Polysaccharide deacetylase family protein n=2 Tax=Lamprobacter modestohalophilus TaxID=1064514 RepID=A0A9X0W9D7_9GAMM|nr:hypothetical protein [Lamprobacter modestohalophilus]